MTRPRIRELPVLNESRCTGCGDCVAVCPTRCLAMAGPLPWLSDHDLDVFASEFERKGTFRGGINWYRNIDANAALLAPFVGRRVEQPALFIGAEYDSIFGQTRAAVEATRAAVPQLQQVWINGSGHWVQQERPTEVNAALLSFLGSLPHW